MQKEKRKINVQITHTRLFLVLIYQNYMVRLEFYISNVDTRIHHLSFNVAIKSHEINFNTYHDVDIDDDCECEVRKKIAEIVCVEIYSSIF